MADLDFPSPTEDSAPPPAYEFSQQEYDQKIRTATEQSLAAAQEEQEQRQRAGPLDEWQSWDEALCETNAQRNQANQQNQGSSSSSSVPPAQNSHREQESASASAKAREAMGQDPYYANNDQYAPQEQTIRPLSIQKRSARPPVVVSQLEKERPGWFDEAQLGESNGSSSTASRPQSASQLPSPRRSLPIPGQLQQQQQQQYVQQEYRPPQHVIPDDPEEDRSMPPPPFAPIAESLDGPAYERYPGESQQRRLPGAGVVLSYNGEDLSASPPPSPPQSPVAQVQGLNLRRRDTPPRINASPNPYQIMHYQAPQPARRPSRQTLAQPPPPPPPIVRQQYVPPPPRMNFNPSIAYEDQKTSIFGQLPMDPLRRGEGAAALYNSAVAAHLTPQQTKSRAPVPPPARRYTPSIVSTVSDYSGNSVYEARSEHQQTYQQSQQFYGSQDFAASRASFYPQATMNPVSQYPQVTQYAQGRQVQTSYPERPMSSMSQAGQQGWSTTRSQYTQQYNQG